MKDLNKCCNENKCEDCAFDFLDTLCAFAWKNKPSTKLSVIVEEIKSELNKLDKEVKE